MAEELGKSWYVVHRPKTMEEYSGPTIKNIVAKRFRNRAEFPHCIYIKGPRGTGKTTFARIISKYYLCENPAEDGTPCECCEMCQSINDTLIAGDSIDIETPGVTEVDATTANGKEAIQEVMEDAIQAPIYTSFKVVIFDECHMITPQAQNALLKLIEDIPSHLVCIFCTTNDEKVLQTIKSRMQLTLEARKQSVKDMANRLLTISQKEGLHVDPVALEIIARRGDRVPRECINLLESIAKTYDGEISVANVKDYVGGMASDLYLDYIKAANESLGSILKFVDELKQKEIKFADFVSGLTKFILDSVYIKHGISLEDATQEYVDAIKELFNTYSTNDFDMLLQIIEHLTNSLAADNDYKNELLIVTTAMRISKVNLLANGLAEEQQEGIAENKESLYEHSKKLKARNLEAMEKLSIAINTTTINDTFEEVSTVPNTQDLFAGINIPDIQLPEETESNTPKEEKLGSEVDDFFNS